MAAFDIHDYNIQAVLNKYVQEAERLFRQRAQAANLDLTGDLINSFRSEAAVAAEGFLEARVKMLHYARFKDLRSLNYTRTPPLSVLEYFVEKVGVEQFAYVPGYPTQNKVRPATEVEAIHRIAWGLKMNRQRRPTIQRGYRGIYSNTHLPARSKE